MKNLKNLINKEEDILANIDKAPYLEEEKEVEHEHLHIKKEVKEAVSRRHSIIRKTYYVLAGFAAFVFVAVLLVGVSYLPRFGAHGNPTANEIVDKFIQDGINDTGATNFVSGMILDYRAFDTLGESFVLFTAISCVFILLKETRKDKKPKKDTFVLFNDPIVRSCASIIIPIIFLFGIYVILNGSISPGGGFSGGAIVGAGLIFYSLVYGHEKLHKFFNIKVFKTITSVSLLTYCLCKAYSFFTSVNGYHNVFNDLIAIQTPGNIFSGGLIFILNLCVGLVVSCTMYGFYSLFKRGDI